MINIPSFICWLIVFYLVKVAAQTDSNVLFWFTCGLSFYLAMFEYPVFPYTKKNDEEENVDDEEL